MNTRAVLIGFAILSGMAILGGLSKAPLTKVSVEDAIIEDIRSK